MNWIVPWISIVPGGSVKPGSLFVVEAEHTQIHMFEKGHIQFCPGCIRLASIKHDLAALIAILQRGHDVGEVVAAIDVVGNMASLCLICLAGRGLNG